MYWPLSFCLFYTLYTPYHTSIPIIQMLSLSPSSPFSRFPHFFFYSSYFIFFFLPTSPLFFSLFFYFIPSHTFLFPLTPNPIHSTLLISIAFSLPRLNKLRLLHTPLFLFFFLRRHPAHPARRAANSRSLRESCPRIVSVSIRIYFYLFHFLRSSVFFFSFSIFSLLSIHPLQWWDNFYLFNRDRIFFFRLINIFSMMKKVGILLDINYWISVSFKFIGWSGIIVWIFIWRCYLLIIGSHEDTQTIVIWRNLYGVVGEKEIQMILFETNILSLNFLIQMSFNGLEIFIIFRKIYRENSAWNFDMRICLNYFFVIFISLSVKWHRKKRNIYCTHCKIPWYFFFCEHADVILPRIRLYLTQ